MRKTKLKKKAIVLLLGLAAMMLPVMASAQGGGLFRHGAKLETEGNSGLMDRGVGSVGGDLTGQGFGATNGNITGQTFGTPLGSGLFVMLAAGVGYATLKSRKKQNKQNRKEK